MVKNWYDEKETNLLLIKCYQSEISELKKCNDIFSTSVEFDHIENQITDLEYEISHLYMDNEKIMRGIEK